MDDLVHVNEEDAIAARVEAQMNASPPAIQSNRVSV